MKKRRTRRTLKKKQHARGAVTRKCVPRTTEEFFSQPPEFQDDWNRALHVVSRMRADHLSLTRASQEYGIDRRKLLKLVGSAVHTKAGRYVASASDRLLRILVVPTPNGLRETATRDSRQASILAEYWDAVQRYLQKGDGSQLHMFRGIRVKAADGEAIPLLTQTEDLDRLGNAGVMSFESLYARAA